jgi:hypothetical protein
VLNWHLNDRFQLAALHITFLCDMATQDDVRHCLKVLPTTLMKAYDEIYSHILTQEGSAPQLALNAFRWVKCSYEPLNSRALLDASTVKLGDSRKFSHDASVKANVLLKACQNLLILDKQLDVFRLAHLSVDEYLETRLPKGASHLEISKACLSLLCSPVSWASYKTASLASPGLYHRCHLLTYATLFWPWHLACSQGEQGCQNLTDIWNGFISGADVQRWGTYLRGCVGQYSFATDTYWQRVRTFRQVAGDHHTLQGKRDYILTLACVFGLRREFENVFASGLPRNRTYINEFLHYPSRFGDLAGARLLVDLGADVSARSKYGTTPLYHALEAGHDTMVRLLVDLGAVVLDADRNGYTPLHVAVNGGNEAMAR